MCVSCLSQSHHVDRHNALQATSHYDVLHQERERERVLHRLLSVDPSHSLLAGGKTKLLESKTVPLSTSTPYVVAWGNPLLQRGIPVDQKQLKESILAAPNSRTAAFAKHPEKPYHLTAGGNKSKVLSNGLFDVIAETGTPVSSKTTTVKSSTVRRTNK